MYIFGIIKTDLKYIIMITGLLITLGNLTVGFILGYYNGKRNRKKQKL